MHTNPSTQLSFACGARMKNRFMLAPLTNTQSHEDGTLSEDELHWLVQRAKGQFGMVMTCASHVQEIGKGFPGQLGIFSDMHIKGHTRLTKEIKAYGSLAVIQLHHAGMRSPSELIQGKAVAPVDLEKYHARALQLDEVGQLKDDFIAAAVRAKKCGYDGVEVHGAHGYIISQFLSAEINTRTDAYGGSLNNRARLLYEIVDGIRSSCGNTFILGVRLSPERFGMDIEEIRTVCLSLVNEHSIDFLDVSLWDSFKFPEEEKYKIQPLIDYFTSLDLNDVKLTVAGNIRTAANVQDILNMGVDFVSIGRAAILHYDYPERVMQDSTFEPVALPVSAEYLTTQGLGPAFIKYMRRWDGFVDS